MPTFYFKVTYIYIEIKKYISHTVHFYCSYAQILGNTDLCMLKHFIEELKLSNFMRNRDYQCKL
jgi:hypothetical protein